MKLIPEWIVGFVDGNGQFGSFKTENETQFYFIISQNNRSISLLYKLKAFFKCGSVRKAGRNLVQYKVFSITQLKTIIIPFFQKYNLKTSKKTDFELLVNQLNVNNLNTSLYSSNNSRILINPEWLLGFIDAEGSFLCSLVNNQILSQFIIALNPKDAHILNSIHKYLGFGLRYTKTDGTEIFKLNSQQDQYVFITKFLFTKGNKDRLRTEKRICARKWSKIILLIQDKQSFTPLEWNKIYTKYINFQKYLTFNH